MLEFSNLQELVRAVSDEKVARELMEQMRWNGQVVCPFCESKNLYELKDGKTYRCKDKTCKKDFTVTVGTIFGNSKIKLSTWLTAMYLITGHKKGISSHQLARDLGITQKSAWFVLHRIRLIMVEPDTKPLETIVEADETYIGGKFANMHSKRRKYFQDREIDNKVAVMGMVEREGRVRMTIIGERTFKDVIRQNVGSNSILMTDNHNGYKGLSIEFEDHQTVNHAQGEYKNGIAHTNTIEGFFSHFKRSIYGIYHQVSPKHLHRYCEETAYRYNNRKITDKQRFEQTLQNTEGRLTYKSLIAK